MRDRVHNGRMSKAIKPGDMVGVRYNTYRKPGIVDVVEYIDYVTRAHKRMDMALAAAPGLVQRYNARMALSAAQSAWQRSSSSGERAECADLIREATAVLR